VHNLVAHIDRRPVFLQGALDNLNRAHDAGTKTARLGEYHFHPKTPLEVPNASMRRNGARLPPSMQARPGYFGKNSVTIKPGRRQRRAADQSWTLP
jgi:hypothetical protein